MGCTASRVYVTPGSSSSSSKKKKNIDFVAGNNPGSAREAAARLNARIEEQLQQARKRNRNTVKILLLGSGESGKSTVLKQMRLIHGNGFTEFERLQYAKVIWYDCVKSMKILISKAKVLNVPLSSDATLKKARLTVMKARDGLEDDDDLFEFSTELPEEIQRQADLAAKTVAKYKSLTYDDDETLLVDETTSNAVYREYKSENENESGDDNEHEQNGHVLGHEDSDQDLALETLQSQPHKSMRDISREKISTAIALLWQKDPGIRQTYARANEFQLEVNAQYYFDHIKDYAQANYRATDLDILIGRIKTTGITETVFDIQGSRICMVDVGGQRSERKKWIHCFDNVTALLFVCASSEFDEVLFEDNSVNRMEEAMLLYEEIVSSRWFYKTPVILFLNKYDILEHKLKKRTFRQYYQEFSGNPTSVDDVLKFLKDQFLAMNHTPSRPVYVHKTCATDTESMRFVLAAVTDVIFQNNLIMSGVV